VTDWLPPEAATALGLSLKVSLVAVLVSLPPGVLVAYALARWRFPGHGLLNGLVHLPLILPPVATGYLLLLTFGRQGWVGAALWDWFGFSFAFRWTGAALAAAIMAFPLLVRPLARRGLRSLPRLRYR
jgi:molybdate transport system permease protein